jgi:tripartite-type tricarboxylate transporter receptor subunit TctC
MGRIGRAFAIAASWLTLAGVASTSTAQTVEEFYRGRQVRFVIHSTPGGAYDSWARLLGMYLTKYLPGQPVFVPQNMPGAGGLVATNYLYAIAPQDGSVIGVVGRNIPSDAVTSGSAATFDPRRFHWIGNPERGATVAIVTDKAPVKTAKELFEREVLVGGAGAGSAVSQMPLVIGGVLGMKFKLVEGYGSQSAITLALERGEVHGTFATLTSVYTSFPGALESGKLHVLFNLERKPVPGLKAPSIFEFAKTDEERQLLTLLAVSSEVGRPMLAPPGTPADRVAALRRAFDGAMKDPQLRTDATKMGLPVDVVSGPELQNIANELMATPPHVVEKMNALTRQ